MYTYDLASRLVRVNDWQSQVTGYAYDSADRLLTVGLPNGITSTYTYDDADRVIGLSHQTLTQTLRVYTYTVDAVGNRTQAQESTPRSSVVATGRSSIASGSLSSNGARGSVTAFTGGTAGLAWRLASGRRKSLDCWYWRRLCG
jgi:YD repeat-containing protein